jgi:hypothetical protein
MVSGMSDPPEVVSGIGRGGGPISPGGDNCPSQYHLSDPLGVMGREGGSDMHGERG